jgi:hypothetical protein
MNPSEIEKVLTQGPIPKAPERLENILKAQISIHPPASKTTFWSEVAWMLRRNGIAIGAFAGLTFCTLAITFQSSEIRALKEEQSQTASSLVQATPGLSQPEKELEKLLGELEQLRTDQQEMQDLQKELTELSERSASLKNEKTLASSNKPVPIQNATIDVNQLTMEETEAAQEYALKIRCVNNLKLVGLAARLWAVDHPDKPYPTDFAALRDELSGQAVTSCPKDPQVSYELLPNIVETEPQTIYSKCPIHGHVGLADGSVQQKADKIIIVNGKLTLQ